MAKRVPSSTRFDLSRAPAVACAAPLAGALIGAFIAGAGGRALLSALAGGMGGVGLAWALAASLGARARLAAAPDTGPGSGEGIDLGAVLASGPRGERDKSAVFYDASTFELLNAKIVDIKKASFKFELFSKDIAFSSANLAARSAEEAEALRRVDGLSADYARSLQNQAAELEALSRELGVAAEGYATLLRRSRSTGDSLKDLSDTAEGVGTAASEGIAAAAAADDAQRALITALEGVASRVRGAGERAVSAGDALGIIDDLAEKTRVLAVNASIEAAHTGAAGRGFQVIAAEIKSLADGASKSVRSVSEVLKAALAEITAADRAAADGAAAAAGLARTGAAGRAAFDALGREAAAMASALSAFREGFQAQDEETGRAQRRSEEAAASVAALGASSERHRGEYEGMKAEVRRASEDISGAARAADILSQLATYLRAGGYDLRRALDAFKTDEARAERMFERRERRELLLYNLEAFGDDGGLVGFLADLSPSGLMLYAEAPPELGKPLRLELRLPLSAEGERRIALACVPRRAERYGPIFGVGCSLAEGQGSKEAVRELIGRLGIDSIRGAGAPPAEEATDAEAVAELEEA